MPTYRFKVVVAQAVDREPRSYLMDVPFVAADDSAAVLEGDGAEPLLNSTFYRLLWENGYVESFNASLRDELLNGEIFHSLREAQIVIESWRRQHNTIRPPAPEVFLPAFTAWPAALPRPAPPAQLPVGQRPTLH